MSPWIDPIPCLFDLPGGTPFIYNIAVQGDMFNTYWRLGDLSLPMQDVIETEPQTIFPGIVLPALVSTNLGFPALYGFASGVGSKPFFYDTTIAGMMATITWNGSIYAAANGTEQTWIFNVPTAPTDATHQIAIVVENFPTVEQPIAGNIAGFRVRLYSPGGATLIDQTYRFDSNTAVPFNLTYSNGAAATGNYKLGVQAVWVVTANNASCSFVNHIDGHVTFATNATVKTPHFNFNVTGALAASGDSDGAINFDATSVSNGSYLSTGLLDGGPSRLPQACNVVTFGWIKTTMAPAKTPLWSYGTFGARRSGIGVRLDPASTSHLYVYTTNADSASAQAGDDFLVNTGVVLNDGAYHWIVAEIGISPDSPAAPATPVWAVIVYVDGVRVGYQDFTTGGGWTGNAWNLFYPGPFYLGCDAATTGSPTYVGTFDEVGAGAAISHWHDTLVAWNDSFISSRWTEAHTAVIQVGTGPTSYDQLIMAQVPVAYWTMGDCGLSKLTDSSGNGHDMSWQGIYSDSSTLAPTFRYPGAAIGDRRCGMYFGTTDGLDKITGQLWYNNDDYTAVGKAWTVSFIYKCLPQSANGIKNEGFSWVITNKDTGGAGNGPFFVGPKSQDGITVLMSAGVSFGTVTWPSFTINDGQWHHYAITNDPVAPLAKFYFDGKLVATVGGNSITGLVKGMCIAGENNGSESVNRPLIGGAANVAVFGRVLSTDEIALQYHAAFGTGATTGEFPDNSSTTRTYLAQVCRQDELGQCRWINVNVTRSSGKFGKKKSAEFTLEVVDDETPTARLFEGEKVRIYRGIVGEPMVRVFTGYVDMFVSKRTTKTGQLIRTYTCTDNRKEIKDAITLSGQVYDGWRPNDACVDLLQKAINTGQYLTTDDNCISQSNVTASDPYAYANPSATPICYFPDLFNDDGSVYYLPTGSVAWVPDLYLQPGGPTTKASLNVPAIASGTNPAYLTFELPKALIIASTFSMTGWNVIDYTASAAVPPPAGAASVDWFNGVLYFNPADTNKLVYLAYAYYEKPLFDFPLGHSAGDAIDEIWTKTGLEFVCDPMGKLTAVYTDIFRAPKRVYGDSKMVNEVSLQIDRDRRNVILCLGFDPTGSQILGAKTVNLEDYSLAPPKGLGKRAYMVVEDKSWTTQAAVNRAAFYCIQQASRRAKTATYQVQGDPFIQLEDVVSFRDSMEEIDPNDFFYVESIDMNDSIANGKVESLDQVTGTSLPGRGYFTMTPTIGGLASGQFNYLQEPAVVSLSNGSTGSPGNVLCLEVGATLQAGGNYYSQVSIAANNLSLLFTPVHSGGSYKLQITGSDGYARILSGVAASGQNTISISILNWTVGAIYVFKLTYIDPVNGNQAYYRDFIRAVA